MKCNCCHREIRGWVLNTRMCLDCLSLCFIAGECEVLKHEKQKSPDGFSEWEREGVDGFNRREG